MAKPIKDTPVLSSEQFLGVLRKTQETINKRTPQELDASWDKIYKAREDVTLGKGVAL